jgi:RNA-directed DNA polymerase
MSQNIHDLAQSLEFSSSELERISHNPVKRNYRYERRLIGKKIRVLRIPIGPMRKVQDAIKKKILDPLPLPETMHGWRKHRSPKTYAKRHLRTSFLVNVDIQDFFPSVNGGMVFAAWMRAGFDEEASKLLTRLTVCDDQLPQGAPTSQAVGNRVLLHLEFRMNRLARLHQSKFSMYGDEFSLSGRLRVKRLKGLAVRIVEQEGFRANPAKVKPMERSERQEIAGIVVNKKPTLGREKYRELRATIYNCVRCGPGSQNREGHPNFKAHLRGRISHLQQVNPNLGNQLLNLFDKIPWG